MSVSFVTTKRAKTGKITSRFTNTKTGMDAVKLRKLSLTHCETWRELLDVIQRHIDAHHAENELILMLRNRSKENTVHQLASTVVNL